MEAVTLRTKRENKGHYVPGMISNGMLYISGQLSLDPDTGKVAEGDIRAHMRQALGNMDAVLCEAGLTRETVVQCRIYLAWTTGTQQTRNTPPSSARTVRPESSYRSASFISTVWSRSKPSRNARRREKPYDHIPVFLSGNTEPAH